MPLQQKLTGIFVLAAFLILAVNLYTYMVVNRMTGRVENVYLSNVRMNELSSALDRVQESTEEYLNTRSSESMEDYYRSEQEFRQQIEKLNTEITDNEMMLAEKNIHGLSEDYLALAADIIQAKRGRNVERYSELFEEACNLYEEIHTYIYSLNNEQFKDNSETYQILMRSLNYTEMITIAVLLVVFVGNISLIVVSTRMMTKPLHRLAESADEVAKGNFDIEKIPIQSMDEVGVVTGAFNQMVESIRNYIEQLRETLERENSLKERELMMQTHLKDAKLKYLQAQINPHFLFNTLNAGAQLAMMEDADRTGEFLENVAGFFRYNVRKHDQDASLEEEIHLVDNYVYILNVRFAGEIHFTKEVDESLMDHRVPSMILQPLVENAVNYGIRGIDWEGHIELSVCRKGGQISISIWDNGAGMEQERIRQVLAGEAREDDLSSSSNGVGIWNVMERLKLYFHGKAALTIWSEGRNKGTEVEILIPDGQEDEEYVPDNAGGR